LFPFNHVTAGNVSHIPLGKFMFELNLSQHPTPIAAISQRTEQHGAALCHEANFKCSRR
jgi:hypothetical protein